MTPSPSNLQPLRTEPHPLAGADGLMTPKDTAAFLGVAVASLSDWRVKGIGPDFVKVGACVRYRRSALEAWLQSHTRKGA